MSVYLDENIFKIQIQLRIEWAVDRTHCTVYRTHAAHDFNACNILHFFQSKPRNKNEAHLVKVFPMNPKDTAAPNSASLCSWGGVLLNYLLVGHCYALFWMQVTTVSLPSLSYKSSEQLEHVQLPASNPYLCRTDSHWGNCKIHCLMQFTDHLERWLMELKRSDIHWPLNYPLNYSMLWRLFADLLRPNLSWQLQQWRALPAAAVQAGHMQILHPVGSKNNSLTPNWFCNIKL